MPFDEGYSFYNSLMFASLRKVAMTMLADKTCSNGLSHSKLTDFVSSILPPKALDVEFLYHVPRSQGYVPSTSTTTELVLSITPTAGVYSALNNIPPRSNPICFLHRPWTLDRRAVPRGALVLASHKSFDELLTVGWNPILATRLKFSVGQGTICVKGYKGDPERRIGLLAPTTCSDGMALEQVWMAVRREFANEGELFDHGSSKIQALAIMNAFHPEEVERVDQAIKEAGWVTDSTGVLYLTGQVREPGLEAAKALGMPVVCVGHRVCEEWGVRFLASALQSNFPGRLNIQVVLEEEEPRPPRSARPNAKGQSQGQPRNTQTAIDHGS